MKTDRIDPKPFQEGTTVTDSGLIIRKYMSAEDVKKMYGIVLRKPSNTAAILKIMYSQNKTAEEAQWIVLRQTPG